MFDTNKIIYNVIEVIEGNYKKNNCVGCGCNISKKNYLTFYSVNNERAVYIIPCCDDCKPHVYDIIEDWNK